MSSDSDTPTTPRFERLEGADQDRLDDFLQQYVLFTAREWAIARLCADYRTKTGVEMTNLGESVPELVPWMDEAYTPQAVDAARRDFDRKVRRAMTTAIYGAMADFYTHDEVDEVVYEAVEAAKLLLEAEGAETDLEREIRAEERVTDAMRAVRINSWAVREGRVDCPHCGLGIHGESVGGDVPGGLEDWKEGFLALAE